MLFFFSNNNRLGDLVRFFHYFYFPNTQFSIKLLWKAISRDSCFSTRIPRIPRWQPFFGPFLMVMMVMVLKHVSVKVHAWGQAASPVSSVHRIFSFLFSQTFSFLSFFLLVGHCLCSFEKKNSRTKELFFWWKQVGMIVSTVPAFFQPRTPPLMSFILFPAARRPEGG